MNKKYVLKIVTYHKIYDERDDDIDKLHQLAESIFKHGFYFASDDSITTYVPLHGIIALYVLSSEEEKKRDEVAKRIAKEKEAAEAETRQDGGQGFKNSKLITPNDKIVTP